VSHLAPEPLQPVRERIGAIPTPGETPNPTEGGEPSPEGEATPEPEATPIISVDTSGAFVDDFSQNLGYFELDAQAVIAEGVLRMGVFDEPCNSLTLTHPARCLAICRECGAVASDFEFSADARFADGVSERYFGAILRFDDRNQDNQVDADEYFLGWAFSVFRGDWALYEHDPQGAVVWHLIESGKANLPFNPLEASTLRVVSFEAGMRVDVFMNGLRMVRVSLTARGLARRLTLPRLKSAPFRPRSRLPPASSSRRP